MHYQQATPVPQPMAVPQAHMLSQVPVAHLFLVAIGFFPPFTPAAFCAVRSRRVSLLRVSLFFCIRSTFFFCCCLRGAVSPESASGEKAHDHCRSPRNLLHSVGISTCRLPASQGVIALYLGIEATCGRFDLASATFNAFRSIQRQIPKGLPVQCKFLYLCFHSHSIHCLHSLLSLLASRLLAQAGANTARPFNQ
jgi:hypothetical protein